MTWRFLATVAPAICCIVLAVCPAFQAAAQDDTAAQPAAARHDCPGVERAVGPLPSPRCPGGHVAGRGRPGPSAGAHAAALAAGSLKGSWWAKGSADKQIEQVLDNLEAVLSAAGSGLDQLVRLNVYALSHQTVDRVREQLSKRLDPAVRPAITAVLTPLPHREALVAVDAVAVAAEKGQAVALERCEAVAGDKDCADAAVLPRGGVAYLSGQPERGGLTASAVTQSMSALLEDSSN